jgi:hypothetical protein
MNAALHRERHASAVIAAYLYAPAQIRRLLEIIGTLDQRVAVGHAANVVGNAPG